MANGSGVQQQQQQRQEQQQQQQQQQQYMQQGTSPFRCKECGICLNSAESLEVHVRYHKNNLMRDWVSQAQSSHEEANNNKSNIKRELISNNTIAAADSSDSMHKKSPDYSRATPETVFGHPPTPQSYQSSSSPYQNPENSTFSTNFQSYPIKVERNTSPPTHQYQNNYPNYSEQQYFSIDTPNQQFNQESFVPKSAYRYHPYNQNQSQSGGSPYDRQAQVSSSSPVYPPQPTPSPSPKQCDKCGYVCESASQLIEHLNMAHSSTSAPQHLVSYQPNQHFMFDHAAAAGAVVVKQEDTAQSEILDLDSQKVVHNVFPEDEKRQNGENNPHSVTAMLNSWPSSEQNAQQQQQQQQKLFQQQEQRLFTQNIPETKLFETDQKLFQPHQIHSQEFMASSVTTTTTQDSVGNGLGQTAQTAYRPFEHMTSPPNTAVITSTQVPANPVPPPAPIGKGANWKSNEARRPKTYNCTACNKWFTSSGHLKRHYNTTLHKNAVKSSGQPDPAGLPISAHHHPAREAAAKQEERPQSGSSGDEVRSEDNNSMPQYERLGPLPGLNGPYDRQVPPVIHHTPPLHSPMAHSPMPQHPSPLGNHLANPNLSNGSPPNGDAGPSTNNLGGLLSLTSPPINTVNTPHGFSIHPQHMMSMENDQFQMYPNELAPHVTPAMDINSLNTTGEYQFSLQLLQQQQQQHEHIVEENQPLPSFAQIQSHKFGIFYYETDNVGGGGAVTTPFATYYPNTELPDMRTIIYRKNEDSFLLTNLDDSSLQRDASNSPGDQIQEEDLSMISMTSENEMKIMEENKMHIMDDIKMRLEAQPKSPEKAHTKRDYEENTSIHVITSTSQVGKHRCHDCNKCFNKSCYLTQHNKTFHMGDKPYKCTRCGKRFACELTYGEHLKKHAGDKPHKCELCPKQFNHKTDLRRHMCLHTGQKPYACETCGKGFIRKDHMVKHCETHLRKTQSKMVAIR